MYRDASGELADAMLAELLLGVIVKLGCVALALEGVWHVVE